MYRVNTFEVTKEEQASVVEYIENYEKFDRAFELKPNVSIEDITEADIKNMLETLDRVYAFAIKQPHAVELMRLDYENEEMVRTKKFGTVTRDYLDEDAPAFQYNGGWNPVIGSVTYDTRRTNDQQIKYVYNLTKKREFPDLTIDQIERFTRELLMQLQEIKTSNEQVAWYHFYALINQVVAGRYNQIDKQMEKLKERAQVEDENRIYDLCDQFFENAIEFIKRFMQNRIFLNSTQQEDFKNLIYKLAVLKKTAGKVSDITKARMIVAFAEANYSDLLASEERTVLQARKEYTYKNFFEIITRLQEETYTTLLLPLQSRTVGDKLADLFKGSLVSRNLMQKILEKKLERIQIDKAELSGEQLSLHNINITYILAYISIFQELYGENRELNQMAINIEEAYTGTEINRYKLYQFKNEIREVEAPNHWDPSLLDFHRVNNLLNYAIEKWSSNRPFERKRIFAESRYLLPFTNKLDNLINYIVTGEETAHTIQPQIIAEETKQQQSPDNEFQKKLAK